MSDLGSNLAIPLTIALAEINAFADRISPQPYSRTVIAIALLRAAGRLVNRPEPIRGPAREAIADEALQLWSGIVGRTDRMRRP